MFYFKIEPNTNIIRDVIEYEHEGYIPVEVDYLPIGVNGGWFKYENSEIVEYPELKPIDENEELEKLKASQAEQDELIMSLLLGGL